MKPISTVELARHYIEEGIISGRFKSGQKIKEEEISKSLDISRPPIREALKALETEGLITRKPRRGVFVAEVKEHDIWEIYTLKSVLYKMAVSLAFDNFTEQVINKLEKTVQKMEACLDSKENSNGRLKYQKYHDQFHDVISIIAGHGRLKTITNVLHNQVKRISYQSFSNETRLRRSFIYHRNILAAIKKGDKSLAEELTTEHVMKALEQNLKVIETPK